MLDKYKQLIVQNKHHIIQFIKFGIVGASNTIISYVVYCVLVYFHVHYLLANVIAFVVSVLNAYYWNHKFVFKSEKRNHTKAVLKTFTSYGVTFLLSTGLLYLMVDMMHVSKYLAPIISLAVTVPLNFLFNKFWAFREEK